MFLALALAACQPETPPAPVPGYIADHGEKVFTVNGTVVGTRELDLVYSLMKIPPERFAEFRKAGEGRHVHEEYAAATVLYDLAIERKLHEDPKIALELAFTARQILGARMRAQLAQEAVTDEAVQKWYDANKAQFTRPEGRVRQILVADQVLAKDLLGRIAAGEDFGTLAAAHSIDPTSKDKGGELGWIRLDDSTIGAAIAAAELGKVTEPFESRFGFHLLQVHEKRDVTPLADVREAAAAQIATEEAKVKIEEIRKKMVIEWVDPPTVEAVPISPPRGGGGGGGGMPADHPPAGGGNPGMPSDHPPTGGNKQGKGH